jgi:hypothetical protein
MQRHLQYPKSIAVPHFAVRLRDTHHAVGILPARSHLKLADTVSCILVSFGILRGNRDTGQLQTGHQFASYASIALPAHLKLL